MALSTFNPPVAPSPGTTNKPEFKLLVADFGDGYSQTSADGINNMRKIYSLTWDTLLPAQCEEIMEFLETRKGAQAFLWTPSNETKAIQVTCNEFSDKRGEAGLRTISATFKQDFNIYA